MARVVLSESEIIEALHNARKSDVPDPPGAFTVADLAKKAHCATRTIREQIAALRAKGLIEDFRVQRDGSDGRQIMVRAYRILRAKK